MHKNRLALNTYLCFSGSHMRSPLKHILGYSFWCEMEEPRQTNASNYKNSKVDKKHKDVYVCVCVFMREKRSVK